MGSSLKDVLPLFRQYNKYLLTTHINPDGDGLGSQLALGEYLQSQKKTVRLINHNHLPRHYKFLDPDGTLISVYDKNRDDDYISSAECIVVLDTNHPGRLGAMEDAVKRSDAVKIVIDHHLESQKFADHYIVDENATATGEIIYNIIKELTGGKLTHSIAVALYTAIMTDTGSFRFPRTNSNTHTITADLLRYSVNPVEIYREVYERNPAQRMKLLGISLQTLQLYHDGRVGAMWVSDKMFKETGTDITETDGFVNFIMQIDGVEIALFFTEQDNSIKISLRARGDIFINELAKDFNGNGHQHAAGALVENKPLSDIVEAVAARSVKYLQNAP